MLVDETVAVSSNILGPGGEVTGRFAFAGPAAAGPFTVAAFGPFLAPAEVHSEIPKTTNPAERIVDVGDIVLEPATGSVRGTVFLPDGITPVGENVLVKIRSLDSSGSVASTSGTQTQPVLPEIDVITDANGQFEFPLVLRGAFVLTADTGAPDPAIRADTASEMQTEVFADDLGNRLLNVRLFGQATGAVPKGETLTANIRLQDVAGVRVRVVENDGTTPVEGARATLTTVSTVDRDPEPGFTDANGEIDFFPVIEGMFSVAVTVPGRPQRGGASGNVPINGPNGLEIPITVTLGAVTTASGQVVEAAIFGSVTGQVFKANGSPLDNPAQVTIKARGADILTTTGSDGRYLAENVPGGFFRVDVFEPFTARRGSATGTLTQDGQTVDVPVTLVGLGSVTGSVFSNDGSRTLPGIDVMLLPSGNFSERLVTRTDPAGVYLLPGVPLGSYTVKGDDFSSGLSGEANGTMLKDGDVNTTNVFLQASGTITGIVYAAGVSLDSAGSPLHPDGTPFPNAPVAAGALVSIEKQGFTQTVQAGNDGVFTSSQFMTVGTYNLTARSLTGGDGATAAGAIRFDGDVAHVAMALRGMGTVEGFVLDSLGVGPVLGASVVLASRSPFSVGAVSRITEADGHFRFVEVPVGEFSISVHTNLQVPALGGTATGVIEAHEQVIVFADGDADLEHNAIRLQDSGEITGHVVFGDGQTAALGAIVLIEQGETRLSRLTDAMGVFSFEGIPLGTYQLSIVEPTSNGVAQRTVTLATNGDVVDLGTIVLDTQRPQVVSTAPGVDKCRRHPAAPIVVTFSEPVDPASVNAMTFRVLVSGTPVAGSFSVSPTQPIATFVPANPLPDLKPVSITLKADKLGFEGQVLEPGIRDLAGLSLAADVSFTFTTGDTAPPSVVSVSPADGALGVDLASVIRIEFSEPIDRSSVQSFTLLAGATPVAATINSQPILGGRVLVLTPSAPLVPNTLYTATVAGPLRDVAGNAMNQAVVTTSFASIDTLAPVIQGFTFPLGANLIQGSTVEVTADLGLTADAASVEFYRNGVLVGTDTAAPFTALLSLIPAAGNQLLLGAIAVDTSGNRSALTTLPLTVQPNQPPTVVITSPGNSSVSLGQQVTVQARATDDIAVRRIGFTANDGVVASGSIEVSPAAAAQASFSFTVPTNFPVGSTIELRATARDTFDLAALSAPVILTVADALPPTVTIGSPANNSAFDPGATVSVFVRAEDSSGIRSITLSTAGALFSSETRAIDPVASPVAQTFNLQIPSDAQPTQVVIVTARAVDAANNTGTRSITLRINDRIAPVVSVAPATGLLQVEPGQLASVQVTASDEVGVRRIDLTVPGITTQSRTITAATQTTQTFEFTVPASLPLGTAIVVNATAQDGAGNSGTAAPLTLVTADLTAPSVTITQPAAGTEVIPGEAFSIRVVATDTVGVARLAFSATGAAEGSGETTFAPPITAAEHLSALTVPADAVAGSAITIDASATDGAGNTRNAAPVSVRVADIVAPRAISITPADGAVDVDPNTSVQVTFSEAVARNTIGATTMVLTGPSGALAGTYQFSDGDQRVTFVPADPLALNTTYTLRLTTSIADVAGNPLATEVTSAFTTIQPDHTAPMVVNVAPNPGAVNVPVTASVLITFSEPLDPASVTTTSATLAPLGSPALAATVTLSADGLTLAVVPNAVLAPLTAYRVTVTTAVTDLLGNALAAPFISGFTTEAADHVGPRLIELAPADGASGVSVRPVVRARFDEAILRSSVHDNALVLLDASSQSVAAVVGFEDGDRTLTLQPLANLEFDASYTIALTGTPTDVFGNAVTDTNGQSFGTLQHTFTTGAIVFVSPVDGQRVIEGQHINLTVDASPSLSLSSVAFFANGVAVGSDTTAPFSVGFTVPTIDQIGGDHIRFGATANLGDVPTVTVRVLPASGDEDGDGIDNGTEISIGTDPLVFDSDQDPDGDGLSNLQEVHRGTNAHDADSDDDGLSDGDEVRIGTDPLNPDTDGDTMPDGIEVAAGLDPLADDSAGDPDGDQIPNIREIRYGSDPFVPNPPLIVLAGQTVRARRSERASLHFGGTRCNHTRRGRSAARPDLRHGFPGARSRGCVGRRGRRTRLRRACRADWGVSAWPVGAKAGWGAAR